MKVLVACISIHAPRVGSDRYQGRYRSHQRISIHAPRVGSDHIGNRALIAGIRISIHAPRVGSDGVGPVRVLGQDDFNPRSPCGERPD